MNQFHFLVHTFVDNHNKNRLSLKGDELLVWCEFQPNSSKIADFWRL